MAIEIKNSELEVFAQNGISEDNIRETISAYRNEGVSDEEIYNKFQQKLSSFSTQKEPEKEQTTKDYTGPNLLKGSARNVVSEMLGGFGPIVAGVTNITASHIGGVTASMQDLSLKPLSELDPRKIPEQYKYGVEEFAEGQKEFAEEHPVAETISKGVGFLGGLSLIGGAVGAASKALGATKAANIASKVKFMGKPNVASAVSNLGKTSATFATYEGAKGATENPYDLSFKEGFKGALKGSIEGSAIAMTAGVLNPVEAQLVARAEKMTGLVGKVLRAAPVVGTSATEGAVFGVLDPALEGRTPTAQDVAFGMGTTVGMRGLGIAATKGLGSARKFLTEPSAKQKTEIQQRAEAGKQVNQLSEQISKKQDDLALLKDEQAIASTKKEIEELTKKRDALTTKETTIKVDVTPTKEQVEAIKKNDKSGKTTDFMASKIAQSENEKRALTKKPEEESLGAIERFRRWSQANLEGFREATDTNRPLTKTKEDLQAISGKEVSAENDPYHILARRNRGGDAEFDAQPVIDELEKAQKKDANIISKLREYLKDKKRLQQGSLEGEELAKLSADVSQWEKDGGKEFTDLAQKVWDYNQKNLDLLASTGRLSDEAITRFKKNTNYVPSKAILNPDEIDVVNRGSGIENALKKFKGEAALYDDPIQASIVQGRQIRYYAETEKAKKAYINMAKETGEATLEKTTKIYNGEFVPTKENQIVIWEKGKPQVWNVPEKVAKIFKPEVKQENGKLFNAIAKGLAAKQIVFKAGTTGLSSTFALMNLVRDAQNVLVGAKSSKYFKPEFAERATKMYFAPYTMDSSEKAFRDRLERSLGNVGTRAEVELVGVTKDNLEKLDSIMNAAEKANKPGGAVDTISKLSLKSLMNFAKKSAAKTGKGIVRGLAYLGNASEKTSRAVAFQNELYKQAGSDDVFNKWIKNPKSIPQSAWAEAEKEAYNVTLNFNTKMNPSIERLNKYWLAYFKPAILGSKRGIEVLSNPEIAPQAWKFITNLASIQALERTSMSKEEAEEWADVNREMAAREFTYKDKNGRIVRLPITQEFGGLVSGISGVGEYILRKAQGKEAREELKSEVLASLKEIADNNLPGVGYLLEPSNLVAAPFRTLFEQAINYKLFSQTPIESESMKRLPAEERYSASTPLTYRLIGKTLGLSPKRLEHLQNSELSSSARESVSASDALIKFAGIGKENFQAEKEVEDNVVLRRFFHNPYTAYSQTQLDYNDMMSELQKYYTYLNKKGDESLSDFEKEKYDEYASLYEDIRKEYKTELDKSIKEMTQLRLDLEEEGKDLFAELKEGKITRKQFDNQKRITEANYTLELREIMKEQKKLMRDALNEYKLENKKIKNKLKKLK